MTLEQISYLLDTGAPASGGDAGYALPNGTLELLSRVIEVGGVRRVFEFGSGRSTKAFLAAGCEVTTVEDSEEWLAQTVAGLTPEERVRLHAVRQRLGVVFYQGAPFRSWRLNEDTLRRLAEAELVLIDSPAFPPFREHALSVSLEHCRRGLIVVDDTGIPTVRRFCMRLADGPGTQHRENGIDHGLFFMTREAKAGVARRRGLLETAKAWRRFFMAGAAG